MQLLKSLKTSDKVFIAISIVILIALSYLIYLKPATTAAASASFLPTLNVIFNSLSTLAIVTGLIFISRRNYKLHAVSMITAFICSSGFLLGYIIYHYQVGDTTYSGSLRPFYLTLLVSHILATAITLPLVLITFYCAATKKWSRHRKVAKYTYPFWLYVSVTGVLIYLFLKFTNNLYF